MKKLIVLSGMVVFCLGCFSNLQAVVVSVDFDTEFAGYELLGEILDGTFDQGNIPGIRVRNGVYVKDDSYVYLYQIDNHNSNSTIKRFTVAPFAGLTENTVMGYLINNSVPPEFAGVVPVSGDVSDLDAWPTAGFYFKMDGLGAGIAPGSQSAILFIASDLAPGMIDGQIINGGVAYGKVQGAVIPEPASILLLGLGVGFLARRKS